MCGRKTLTKDVESIIQEMGIESWRDSGSYQLSYNISPSQSSPVMIDDMGRHVKMMKWGLIPNWATDASIGSKLINARAETLLEKPSFKNLVSNQRCIVLSDGYFEWKRSNSRAIPYYIYHPNNKILLLEAGGKDTNPWIHIPGGYFKTINNPNTDWCFNTEKEPNCNNREMVYPRGKTLGGSSSINGMPVSYTHLTLPTICSV